MDPDSVVFNKQTEVLNPIKQKCLATLEQTSMEGASKELTDFRTPQKITFQTPKTPKSGYGDELSISLETVKEKAKHSVLFYRLFLSAKFINPTTNQSEVILGNLSETFLTVLNAG